MNGSDKLAKRYVDWYIKNDENWEVERTAEGFVAAPPHKAWLQEVPPWNAVAFGALRAYCAARHTGHIFQAADFLTWLSRYRWIKRAPDQRAWGPVFVRAAQQDLIEHAGYERSKAKSRHRAPSTLWRIL
jgi:hypothetical protein